MTQQPPSITALGGVDSDNSTRLACQLPPELLLHIFEHTLDTSINDYRLPSHSQTAAPLVLSWVCSSWRRLAITTPRLWTSISLGSHGSSPACDAWILDLFISRSGIKYPLSFAMNYDAPGSARQEKSSLSRAQSKAYVASMHKIARRLVAVRHRWRHLIVNALVLDALAPLFRALPQGTPLLEYLSLSTKYTGFHGREYTMRLTSCNRLRTVRILSPMVFFDPSLPLLPNLTTLDLHFVQSLLDAIAWLAACPNLERLSIELYASLRRHEPLSTLQIRLERLSHFSLTCSYGESDPGPLLDCMITPNLQSLHFIRYRTSLLGPDNSWQNIVGLLERSEDPPLHELHLIDTPEHPDQLSNVLQRASRVKYLALEGEAVTDELIQQLYAGPVGGELGGNADAIPLCQKLETLELHDVPACFPTIIDVARSRTKVFEGTDTGSNAFRTLKSLILSYETFGHFFNDPNNFITIPSDLSIAFKPTTAR
ncbi:uncharacterized protein FOMMEDRAFT_154332 [Fomitiporia mediterranea MF3/22]|uniref:uncharacterized protein n=1 Tax=Fomitiporia mediterranea (strain MF3/22) TaxID=694068 RepID=UPI0004407533|nr:uncharacterized protein FOMMEDRAFT_154332 [Fomitiporia mediterranea MF3/22]EJD05144.1 hypothetical protein FOMMEDRAFT_154332 [Fomitiporia mediterranea MF3/22]